MPIRNGDYETRDEDDLFDTVATELVAEEPSANPRSDSTYTNAVLVAIARTLAQNQELSLQEVYRSAYVVDATGEELSKKARNLGVVREEATKATGVVTFSRDSPATSDYTAPSGTTVETVETDPKQFETTEPTTIDGDYEDTDTTTYQEGGTAFVTKTSFDVDVTYRDSLDVEVDLRTTNSSYTAEARVADATNGNNIDTYSTTNTTFVDKGPTTYDTSSITGTITVEYRLRISDSSGTAELENSHIDVPGETAAKANIEAVEAGSDGNVGPNAIEAMPSPPTGIEDVTNNDPTGDPSLDDTNGDPLRLGRDREDDDELRTRVLDTDAVDEGPSASGIELALDGVDGVISAHVNTNQTNSTVNGLDPYHSEAVVYGGDTYDIARTLYETMSATTVLRLQGGVNGSKESDTVFSQLLDQDITVPFTRPTKVTFALDLDVVHTSTYEGDVAVKDTIVEYVGGTRADDSTTTGTEVGENVLVNEIENRVEDVQGVDYADVTLLDTDDDGTDDTTTDSDGVPVLSITNSEVARLDADDVTLATTAR